jgi:hypothetical protein
MADWLTPIIVALAAVAGTSLPIYISGRQRSREKVEDWARQDAVAAKAAEAARLLLAAQKASIERTDEVARLAAEADKRTATKLDAIDTQGKAIHVLVNQKLTDVIRQALAATVALEVLLEEAIERTRAAGGQPTHMDLTRLDETRRSIVDLKANLQQRAENQAEVDADKT